MNFPLDQFLTAGDLSPAGMTFNIRITPDLFTGEVLNVGVAVIGTDGRRFARVIEEPGRLTCLYGEDSAKSIVFLAKLAAAAVENAERSPSPNIVFAEPQPFFNLSSEEALSQFFRDQVTVAIPQRQEVTRVEPLKTELLRSKIYEIIRGKSLPMREDRIIPQSPLSIIQTTKGPRTVRIPLQPENGAGGLESADYSAQSVRMHLMDALLDLECAAEAKSLTKLGLFIARPTGSVPEKRLREVDNAIDYVVWRAPRNCHVEVESDLDRLSDGILNWAERKAA